jgi:hypothetical protein
MKPRILSTVNPERGISGEASLTARRELTMVRRDQASSWQLRVINGTRGRIGGALWCGQGKLKEDSLVLLNLTLWKESRS